MGNMKRICWSNCFVNLISSSHSGQPLSAGYRSIVTPVTSINWFSCNVNVSVSSTGLGTVAGRVRMVHIPNSELNHHISPKVQLAKD